MAGSTVAVKFTGDVSQLKRGLDEAEGRLGGFASSAGDVGKKVAAGLAIGGAGALALGGHVLTAGSQLESIAIKADTVFEKSAASVRKWADKNNEAFGLTDQQLLGLAANFGDLLKPMGFTAAEAAEMSKDVIGLSGALSEWSGGTKDAAEVSEILAAAMLGETDGLKSLGIAISAEQIAMKMAEQGTDKLTGAALEQAKAMATQELIFEKSEDAQKAYAKGGNEALRTQNEMKAGVAELQEGLVQGLLPAVVGITKGLMALGKWIADNTEYVIGIGIGIGVAVVPAFVAWATAWWAVNGAAVASAAPFIAAGAAIAALVAGVIWAYQNWDWFREAVDRVAQFLTGVLWPALQKIVSFITDNVVPVIANLIEWYASLYVKVAEIVVGIVSKFDDLVAFVVGLPGRIRSAASGMWDGITAAFKSAINTIIRGWNSLQFKVPGFKIGPVGYDGFTLGLPPIQSLASGGVLTSPRLVVAGDAGAGNPEIVTPERLLDERIDAGFARNGRGNDRAFARLIAQELAAVLIPALDPNAIGRAQTTLARQTQ